MDSNTNTKTIHRTVHLQYVGPVPAIPAGDLEIGHVTMWNYGYLYEVRAIAPRGKTQVTVTLVDMKTGKEWPKVMGRTRLVGLAGDL